ncbi:MAG: hypothetical protein KDA96_03860 [Planctomycetaceae bacterium]|nr:hypothetical protein [Planctomycetaceae bacterium]
MHEQSFSLPDDALGYWRLAGDESPLPVRPITSGECRIGSGPDCQLRLMEGDIPPLHSVLRITGEDVRLSCCCSEPDLIVNGSVVRECCLYDGDLVEIGLHRMLFRSAIADQRISLSERAFATGHELEPAEDTEVDAAHLVDCIEHELALMTELERTTAQSIRELLTCASERQQSSTPVEPHGLNESSGLVSVLQQQITLQASQLRSMSEVVEQLVHQQQLTARTLQALSERMETLQQAILTGPSTQRRASA